MSEGGKKDLRGELEGELTRRGEGWEGEGAKGGERETKKNGEKGRVSFKADGRSATTNGTAATRTSLVACESGRERARVLSLRSLRVDAG